MHITNNDNPDFIKQTFSTHNITVSGPFLHTLENESQQKFTKNPYNYSYIKHSHSFNEMVIVSSGRAIHCIDEEEYLVQAGDVFLIQNDHDHYFKKTEDLIIYNLMIKDQSYGGINKEIELLPGYSALFIHEPEFREKNRFKSRLKLNIKGLAYTEGLLEKIKQEQKDRNPGYETAIRSYYFLLLTFLIRNYQETAKGSAHALLRISPLLQLLEKNFSDFWNLKKMCDYTSLSQASLGRYFLEATGESPINFLISLRLAAAEKLLRDSTLNITEIAFETGFNDSNYFSRIFTKKIGSPPLFYRNKEGKF